VDLRSILRAVRDSWLSIAVITLLAGLVAWYVAGNEPAVYQAKATVVVAPADTPDVTQTALERNLLTQQRAKSLAVLMRGDQVMRAVSDRLGLGVTPDVLAGQITAGVAADTTMITVTVTDSSAARAQSIANATTATFIDLVPQLEATPGNPKAAVDGVTVVTPAPLPGEPISGDPLKPVVGGVFLGLLCGVGLAVARQHLDPTVRRADQLAALPAGPVLGVVGVERERTKTPLVSLGGPYAPRAEVFRKIRTALCFADADRANKVILVTSPAAAEGRTATACDLALMFARSGLKVLLVDADLRRPGVAGYLGLPATGTGLSNVLSGTAAVEDALRSWGDGRLTILTSGPVPTNPSELLGSPQLSDLLDRMRGEYDFVVLDAPPALPVTDAVTTAAACDGVVLVARWGRTRTAAVVETLAALRTVGAHPLGTVLGFVPPRATPYRDGHPPRADETVPVPDRRQPEAAGVEPDDRVMR
jgi:capsular exopolysaccharide synthesis family protein